MSWMCTSSTVATLYYKCRNLLEAVTYHGGSRNRKVQHNRTNAREKGTSDDVKQSVWYVGHENEESVDSEEE